MGLNLSEGFEPSDRFNPINGLAIQEHYNEVEFSEVRRRTETHKCVCISATETQRRTVAHQARQGANSGANSGCHPPPECVAYPCCRVLCPRRGDLGCVRYPPPRRGAEGRLNPNMRCHSRASRRLLPATVIQAVTSFRGWTSRVIRELSSRLALRSSHSASRRNHQPSERPK